MSEEILKALMQLFAIITKQDGGVEENEKKYVRSFLSQQLGESASDVYYNLFRQLIQVGKHRIIDIYHAQWSLLRQLFGQRRQCRGEPDVQTSRTSVASTLMAP